MAPRTGEVVGRSNRLLARRAQREANRACSAKWVCSGNLKRRGTAVSAPWIDISLPLRQGMPVWPGDPPFVLEQMAALERGDPATVSRVVMSVHTGTHVDAPAHFLLGGAPLGGMPLEATMGPARVLALADSEAITAAELRRHHIRRGERVLFRTRNSDRGAMSDTSVVDFVALRADAARLLAERQVRCVGIDGPSIGSADIEGDRTHTILLGAGVWIIEGLDLSRVVAGRYDLACLPLRLPGAEGAPARAVLRARRGWVR